MQRFLFRSISLIQFKRPISGLLISILIANIIVSCLFFNFKETKAQGLPVVDWVAIGVLGGIATNTTFINASTAATAASTETIATYTVVMEGELAAIAISSAITAEATTAIAEIEAAETEWEILKELARAAGYAFLVALLQELTTQIIAWINGEGDPKFINDWQGFIGDVANKAGGKFVTENLGLGFLCGRFDMDIKIALSEVPNFKDNIKCTLTDMGHFFDDFKDGGWKTWLSLNQPKHNIFGAYMMALDKKMDQEAKAQAAAVNEAIASAGFLSDKTCVQRTCCLESCQTQTGEWGPTEVSDENLSCSCDKWRTKTPGKTIADIVSKAADQGRQLLSDQIADLTDSLGEETSNLITPFITAIAMAATNRLIGLGVSAIAGE